MLSSTTKPVPIVAAVISLISYFRNPVCTSFLLNLYVNHAWILIVFSSCSLMMQLIWCLHVVFLHIHNKNSIFFLNVFVPHLLSLFMLYHPNHPVRDSSRNVQYWLLHLIFCARYWSWLCNSWETEGHMQLFPTLNGEIYCCTGGNSQLFENDFTTQGWSPNDSSFVLEIVQYFVSLFAIMEGYKKVFYVWGGLICWSFWVRMPNIFFPTYVCNFFSEHGFCVLLPSILHGAHVFGKMLNVLV